MLWTRENRPFQEKFPFLPEMLGPTAAAKDIREKVVKDGN